MTLNKKDIELVNHAVARTLTEMGNIVTVEKKPEPKTHWEPKEGDRYEYIDDEGCVIIDTFDNVPVDLRRKEYGNVFKPGSGAAKRELLRRKSMAERGEEPEEGETFYVYGFLAEMVCVDQYDRMFYSDYIIGNTHKTKEEEEAWEKEFRSAFLNLKNY